MDARYVTYLVLSPWESSFCASPYIAHLFLSSLYLFLFIFFCAFISLFCSFVIFLSPYNCCSCWFCINCTWLVLPSVDQLSDHLRQVTPWFLVTFISLCSPVSPASRGIFYRREPRSASWMEQCRRLNDLVTSDDPPDPFISPDHALEPRKLVLLALAGRGVWDRLCPKRLPSLMMLITYCVRWALMYCAPQTLMEWVKIILMDMLPIL